MVLDSAALSLPWIVRQILNFWKTGKGMRKQKMAKISSNLVDVKIEKLLTLHDNIPEEIAL